MASFFTVFLRTIDTHSRTCTKQIIILTQGSTLNPLLFTNLLMTLTV